MITLTQVNKPRTGGYPIVFKRILEDASMDLLCEIVAKLAPMPTATASAW